MPDDLASALQRNIPLFEMIETVRRELQASLEASKGEALRFVAESVELELRVVVTREKEGQGGVQLWVVNAGGKYTASEEQAHTIKLTLKPKLHGRDGEVLVSDTSTKAPR